MEKTPLLRKAFIWNTLASMTYACMSFLMTLVTVRLCGEEAGGVFSIAFSSSQMLQAVALFGMRNYQATDISFQFQFQEYLSSRMITSAAMAGACVLYAGIMGFQGDKLIIYILFCGVKLFEALADILEGMIHQHDRLNRAAQGMFLRSVATLTVFVAALILSSSLVTASWLALAASALGLVLCSWPLARKFEPISFSTDLRRVWKLLAQCLPLFLVAMAGAYLNNAPKVAIELHMDDRAQAQFAIVFMPAFVINLVSGFIFRPMLTTMASYFRAGETKLFQKMIRTMILIDVGITLIALAGTWICGVPVLSWIYGIDISRLKRELLLIVLSGGFCALVGLLCQALTVIRRQTSILFCYLIVVALTLGVSNYLVVLCGMMGAVGVYILSMILLTFFLEALYVYYMKRFSALNG